MVRSHRELILDWFRARGQLSNGIVEGFNGKAGVTTKNRSAIAPARRWKSCCITHLATYPSLFPGAFYDDEWEQVIQANGVTTADEYLRVPRTGRGARRVTSGPVCPASDRHEPISKLGFTTSLRVRQKLDSIEINRLLSCFGDLRLRMVILR